MPTQWMVLPHTNPVNLRVRWSSRSACLVLGQPTSSPPQLQHTLGTVSGPMESIMMSFATQKRNGKGDFQSYLETVNAQLLLPSDQAGKCSSAPTSPHPAPLGPVAKLGPVCMTGIQDLPGLCAAWDCSSSSLAQGV